MLKLICILDYRYTVVIYNTILWTAKQQKFGTHERHPIIRTWGNIFGKCGISASGGVLIYFLRKKHLPREGRKLLSTPEDIGHIKPGQLS